MSCKDIDELLQGYLDAELALAPTLAIEQHLKDCPACACAHREHQSLQRAMAGMSLYFDAPKGLEKRVRSAVRRASKAEAEPERRHGRWRWKWNSPSVLAPLGMAAVLAMQAALAWATFHSTEHRIPDEIVSAHVRSLMVDHKTDIASSDQHTVKPWFDGKLDFAPPVVELAERGFPLVGGRLDYLHGRPVAALVYQRHKHFINLFIWPAPGTGNTAKETMVRQGYNLVHWNRAQMTFWAVSDLNSDELSELMQPGQSSEMISER